jgi:glucose/arabinose dehydrogenase/endonuclease YncB( thermonuclease family)
MMTRRLLAWLVTIILVLPMMVTLLPSPSPAAAQEPPTVPPGGAPPPGSGDVEFTGFARVIDGETMEVTINGKQTLVGLLGIEAPQGNTPCGREATALLSGLLNQGPVILEEEPALAFDARLRRMYHAGDSRGPNRIVEELVQAGVVRVNGTGKHAQRLTALEAQARGAGRGCAARAGAPGATSTVQGQAPDLTSALSGDGSTLSYDVPLSPNVMVTSLATTLPSGFVQDVVAGGTNQATAFAFLPGGRILLAEKDGKVRLYKDGTLSPTPFLDISGRVNDYWDHGLRGLAVDPNFAQNGFIYLLYTYENDPNQYNGGKTQRVARFTAAGDTADPGSEVAILGTAVGSSCSNFPAGADCIPAEVGTHEGGNIKFAADGTLFVSTGDAANYNVVDDRALRSQNLDSLAGKLLHVTTSGAAVPANPFWTGDARANRSKVWAYGLRNAFRFNLRPGSDVPYIGDVGWNNYEEVDVATAGANFGWPCYEGAYVQSGTSRSRPARIFTRGGPGRYAGPWSPMPTTARGRR